MVDARGINIEPLIDEMTGCLLRHHPLERREDPDPAAEGGSLRREGESLRPFPMAEMSVS